jgi:hypothetical protein
VPSTTMVSPAAKFNESVRRRRPAPST